MAPTRVIRGLRRARPATRTSMGTVAPEPESEAAKSSARAVADATRRAGSFESPRASTRSVADARWGLTERAGGAGRSTCANSTLAISSSGNGRRPVITSKAMQANP